MPLSMETAEKKLAGEPSVARFIIPLGATINMDGTALYQVAAAVFLTQVFGVHLDIWGLIGLAGTAVGGSIGTPSTLDGVDRILDMSRTTVNVTGDLTACTVMNRWLKPSR
jgi:proton glutamate symport protein